MRVLALVLFLAAVGRPIALAQPLPPAPPGSPSPAATAPATPRRELVALARRALAEELAGVERTLAATWPAGREDLKAAIEAERTRLQAIDLLHREELGALALVESEGVAAAAARERLEELRRTGLREPPPYPFLVLDRTRDEAGALAGQLAGLETGARVAQESLVQAKAHLADAEAERRRLKETVRPETATPLETSGLRSAELAARQAEAEMGLREAELAHAGVQLETARAQKTELEERAARMAAAVAFSRSQLQEALVGIEKELAEVGRALDAAKLEETAAERRWAAARRRADEGAEGNEELAEEVAALQHHLQAIQRAVVIHGQRAQRLEARKLLWERRFKLANGAVAGDELARWEAEATAALEQLERDAELQRARLADLRGEQAAHDARADALAARPVLQRWVRERSRTVLLQIANAGSNLAGVEASRRLTAKLLDEIGGQSRLLSVSEQGRRLGELVAAVWRFELTVVDDHPVTVGKVAVALVLLLAGFALSHALSRWLGWLLGSRLGMDVGAASALQALSLYFFLFSFAISAFLVAGVPLTIFTFLGGALAIGVGFGSQNILNNFISGLILLVERPIRAGDLVEVDGTFGRVMRIGARCTQVRTEANIDILVPNGSFLQSNVVNWTLSDDRVRIHLDVGVAYGSSPDQVSGLMMMAAQKHPDVLLDPAPRVLFLAFGESCLQFQLQLWIRMTRMSNRVIVPSELRFRIHKLFKDMGIRFDYPQRDVHLDAPGGIEVRIAPPPPAPVPAK